MPALAQQSGHFVVRWDQDVPKAKEWYTGVLKDMLGTLDRIESTGFELVEMVLADGDSWDRYSAAKWMIPSKGVSANRS